MATYIDVPSFHQLRKTIPVFDVRSPGEFETGHIPDAISFPIFTDDERAQVGTRYKQSGHDFAVELGLELVGHKLAGFVRKAKKLVPDKTVILHCWRGGMRSASMGWLLETAGFKVYLLEGGYKEYRRYNREQFSKATQILILSGFTGSGKTDVLHELKKQGEQIVDLEGIAHHKGSAFGAIGQEPQPSNEQFENNLAEVLLELDLNKPIWLEDESITMGKNGIPDTLFILMRKSPVYRIIIPKEIRAKRLVKEYADFGNSLLKEAIERIQSKLGGKRTQELLDLLNNSEYSQVALLTLDYYDKAYLKGLEKRDPKTIFTIEFAEDNPLQTAIKLIDLKNSFHLKPEIP